MNKTELKRILRPLIKECIKEVIFEEGTLSTIISEVVRGTSGVSQPITETRTHERDLEAQETKRKRLLEQKRKMLDAIGKDAYNGVNLFEGTTPSPPPRSSNRPHGSGALDGVAPSDPGVDLSAFGLSPSIMKRMVEK